MDSECASQNCLLQKFEQKNFDESPDFISREIKALDNILNRKLIAIATKAGVEQVTVMHGWIIKYLYINRENDIFQKDIEAEFAIARSTVTSILKLMEKKNYIRRISIESDARLKK
ncbi:MAG: MarR family transcriptional regulator [Clostridiales bacterium]|nr:MarR family transcriptional regulator [Clostridiales bacterium]